MPQPLVGLFWHPAWLMKHTWVHEQGYIQCLQVATGVWFDFECAANRIDGARTRLETASSVEVLPACVGLSGQAKS